MLTVEEIIEECMFGSMILSLLDTKLLLHIRTSMI